MSVGGHVLISIPLSVQSELKKRGWVRNAVSYGHVIATTFKRVDELTVENKELKHKQKQIDDIQLQVARMATGLVGAIDGD